MLSETDERKYADKLYPITEEIQRIEVERKRLELRTVQLRYWMHVMLFVILAMLVVSGVLVVVLHKN